jgi:hypothetical protein
MLDKESLWATATRCHRALAAHGIPHAIVSGGMTGQVRESLEADGFCGNADEREFRDASGVAVQLLVAGERAGRGARSCCPTLPIPPR